MCQIILKKKSLSSQKFRIVFNFEWIKKSKVAKRLDKLGKKLYEHKKRKLRESLHLGEKVLLVAEKIKKKSATRKFYKSSVQNISFFNKEKVFVISNKKKYRWKYILLGHWHKEQWAFKRKTSKTWTICYWKQFSMNKILNCCKKMNNKLVKISPVVFLSKNNSAINKTQNKSYL